MTRKIYRTAQGKMVDIGALQLQNENVRAVGNMPVNARGDLVDSMNRPIDTRNKQVAKQYNKQTSAKRAAAPAPAKSTPAKLAKETRLEVPPAPEDFDDDATKESITDQGSSQVTGLAAAIARARQIKQEPLKTPRQAAQDTEGVKKL